jgi:hypothetical protein
MTAITAKEREIAARATYASARIEWHRHAEPEEVLLDGTASSPKPRAHSK